MRAVIDLDEQWCEEVMTLLRKFPTATEAWAHLAAVYAVSISDTDADVEEQLKEFCHLVRQCSAGGVQ